MRASSFLATAVRGQLTVPLIVLLLLVGSSAGARADAIADFYKGKEVRLIIPASVAGGYDTYARAVARHLGQHIPGNPTIVAQNMPAAGGLGAANHLNNVAAKDGTVIALFQNTVPLEPFYDNKQAQFDAAKFGWLGTPTTEVALYMIWHASKIKTLQDAQSQEFVAGAAGAASTPAFYGGSSTRSSISRHGSSPAIPDRTKSCWQWRTARSRPWHRRSGRASRPRALNGTRSGRSGSCFNTVPNRIPSSRACRSRSISCKRRPTGPCWSRRPRRSASAVPSARRPGSRPIASPRCARP